MNMIYYVLFFRARADETVWGHDCEDDRAATLSNSNACGNNGLQVA
jgi:hypothetical protein